MIVGQRSDTMLAHIQNRDREINEDKIVDEIRALSIDMIREAGSGHSGIALGGASILYTLYAHHLRFDPKNPSFYNRDRFVMSSGHGSSLLYATLCMAGYPLDLEDLKKFRTLHSKTSGHPEYNLSLGVEATTGPLGEGIAMAVGMAMAGKHSRALLNNKLIDYHVYCYCGDGDLMEGVSYEAMSLAGSLNLDNLILLYDSNHVSLDGATKNVFDDNIEERVIACNFDYIEATDEIESLDKAILEARQNKKPTLIEVKTTIGKYAKDEGKNTIHGRVLEKEEITKIKKKMGLRDIPFTITNESLEGFQILIQNRNEHLVENFEKEIDALEEEEKKIVELLRGDKKTITLSDLLYETPEDKKESLRLSSFKVLNAYAKESPLLFGGCADVSASTLVRLEDTISFSKDHYEGRNIMFGVREHSMAAVANGLALSGYRPFVSTYLCFSDYLKPALRLSSLMDLPVTYIFTHDSISIGEDGPTHMPVEQIVTLRALPNMEVYRPADSNEVIGSYRSIMENMHPASILLSRNTLPILDTTSVPLVSDGAYIVRQEERDLDGIIIATGEEVSLALDVIKLLQEKGYDIRLVSMPSMERYEKLEDKKKEELLPIGIKKFVIEKSSSYSWYFFTYNDSYLFTQDVFGLSGKKEDVEKEFHFTKEEISLAIEALLK